MKMNWRFGIISFFVILVVTLLSILGNHAGISASLATPTPGGPPIGSLLKSSGSIPVELALDSANNTPGNYGNQVPSAPAANVSLVVDDGSWDDAIGFGGTTEFIFLNRFTPNPSLFPFTLNEIDVVFLSETGVAVGDDIVLVVYQDADSDPSNGATLLLAYPEKVQALDAWNAYVLNLTQPLVVSGPVDVLVGVIALEKPGTGYYAATIDLTASQQRSWIGLWSVSPPPQEPTLPPDNGFGTIDSFGFSGNWMIRAYGETTGTTDKIVYLPLAIKRWPPIPDAPVLSPINNPDGNKNYTVNWNAVEYATSYILQEDEDYAFGSPAIRYNGPGTSWSASNQPYGTFYYRVKASNSWGDSGWSNTQSTTVKPPLPPQTTVYVTNNTNGQLCYEVLGTGIGRKCWSSGRNLYGTFNAGTYNWTASSTRCGSASGSDYFPAGIDEEEFHCVSGSQGPDAIPSALQCATLSISSP